MLNNRLAHLADYPFTRLAKLLAGIDPPAGREPILMSLGEPRHAPPELIDRTLRDNAHLWGKYPPVSGTSEFRTACAGWLNRRYALPAERLNADASILPVAGTREALFMAALLVVPECKAGRVPAVLLPNPFYAVYQGAGLIAGAEPVFLTASRRTGFLPDLDALTPELLERTALVYLCTPSNPQGAVATADYLTRALILARRYNFVLAADECYAEIYSGTPPAGALEAAAALDDATGVLTSGGRPWANLLVFHSLSKRSSAAGLRSGFVAGDPDLIAAFARLRGYGNAGSPLPVLAAAAALWADDAHVEDNRTRYRAKFDAAEAVLGGRFGFGRPAGGFFLWLEVGDGEAAARKLWAEEGVRVLPGAYVSHPDANGVNPGAAYIRVALIDEPALITAGCEAIVRCLVS
ncbi:Aspartate aminotransferase [uncultured Gammaproteobacteria bacterium]